MPARSPDTQFEKQQLEKPRRASARRSEVADGHCRRCPTKVADRDRFFPLVVSLKLSSLAECRAP
jgi:hypothetical protein